MKKKEISKFSKNVNEGIVSLKIKLFFIFLIYTFTLVFVTSILIYNVLNRQLFLELQKRTLSIVEISSKLIDISSLERLKEISKSNISKRELAMIEMSDDYLNIYEILNKIRNTSSDIIKYIYIFIPTENINIAKYIVDADVIQNIKEGENDENISHFNKEFDISIFPVLQQSILENKVMIEKNYYYDPIDKIYSFSGYSPIKNKKGQTIAFLGIDVADKNVNNVLKNTIRLIILIGIGAFVIAAIISLYLGSSFTKGIRYLADIVSKFSEKNFKVRANLKSKDEVGKLAFSFNIMAQTIEDYSNEINQLLNAYDKFVPHDFLDHLSKKKITELKLGDNIEKEMTILFSDIRGFTTLSEKMTPEENFKFLNSYLTRVGPIIREKNGFIDKYIGDAIMALFPNSTNDAVDAAISMRLALLEYNNHRQNSGYQPINIGVGIHGGKLILGTIGEEKRMDTTVIADAVNLASRLEGLTKFYGCGIIISEYSFNQLENKEKYHCRFLDKVCVKGKNTPIKILEILNADNEDQINLKKQLEPEFLKILQYYYSQDFKTSKNLFIKLKKENPDDHLFDIYIDRCEKNIKYGVNKDWNGVEILEIK